MEDNNDLATEIQTLLNAKRMIVERVATISSARDYLAGSTYDLIILDWNLPDGIGIDLLKDLRDKRDNTSILMLTERSAIAEKAQGFGLGADDYLTKPFHPTELICRIQALARRPHTLISGILSVAGLSLNPDSREVTKHGALVDLSPKEFALLEFFMRNRNHVFTADALLERVWEAGSEATAQSVVATILRLRKKLDSPNQPSYIQNVFGQGYVFKEPESNRPE